MSVDRSVSVDQYVRQMSVQHIRYSPCNLSIYIYLYILFVNIYLCVCGTNKYICVNQQADITWKDTQPRVLRWRSWHLHLPSSGFQVLDEHPKLSIPHDAQIGLSVVWLVWRMAWVKTQDED